MKPNWELTGHEWAVNLLRRQVATGETRHAYLFAGPTGVGRRTLAMKFAQALNCTNPPAPGEYCGECRDCKMAAAMRHPDLAIVAPVVRDGTIKVEQVREAQSLIYLKPYQSQFRISLFLDFQQATISAQNAMLKTLEEAARICHPDPDRQRAGAIAADHRLPLRGAAAAARRSAEGGAHARRRGSGAGEGPPAGAYR